MKTPQNSPATAASSDSNPNLAGTQPGFRRRSVVSWLGAGALAPLAPFVPLGLVGCGGGDAASVGAAAAVTPPVTPIDTTLKLLAGAPGGRGRNNSTNPQEARFNSPSGVAVDRAGNVYVADMSNHVIRKITPAGVSSTFAGQMGTSGTTDGTGSAARFNWPASLAIDASGNLYVADRFNHRIRLVTPAGVVTTVAGSTVGYLEGTGTGAQFKQPQALALNPAGTVLYVADTSNNRIRQIDLATGNTSLVAGSATFGSAIGNATTTATFSSPIGLAVNAAGTLVYVADLASSIRKIDLAAQAVAVWAGTSGSAAYVDATGTAARFNAPGSLAMGALDNLYVADSANHAIRKIDTGAVVTNLAGSTVGGTNAIGSADGTGTAARFNNPRAVALDAAGNVYVVEDAGHTVRKITPAGVVSTFAGLAEQTGSTDATGSAARFNGPRGLAADNAGNLYVSDQTNQLIRKINPSGAVSTLAGTLGILGAANGQGTAASFRNPQGLAVNAAGIVFVADSSNYMVRQITPGGAVSTLAGSGTTGYNDSATGSLAKFRQPVGVALDAAGNVLVADSSSWTIRSITPSGAVSTVAGADQLYGSADGPALTVARFNTLLGLATDPSGNVWILDAGNRVVRRLSGGNVSTMAGTLGTVGFVDGTGTAAQFTAMAGIAVDAAGNAYVPDSSNNAIRKVTPAGVVSTLAWAPGPNGLVLNSPQAVAVSGNLLLIALENAVVTLALS